MGDAVSARIRMLSLQIMLARPRVRYWRRSYHEPACALLMSCATTAASWHSLSSRCARTAQHVAPRVMIEMLAADMVEWGDIP